jgi:hypothetical protein
MHLAFSPYDPGLMGSVQFMDLLIERGDADAQLRHFQAVDDRSAVRLLGQLLLDRQAVLHDVADVQSRPVYARGDVAEGIRKCSGISIGPTADDDPTPGRSRLCAFLYGLIENERAIAHAAYAVDAHFDRIAQQLPQLAFTVATAFEKRDRLKVAIRRSRQSDVAGATAKHQRCARDQRFWSDRVHAAPTV